MRIAATAATVLFAFAACSTTETASPYQQPNELMGNEIDQRIAQIPFQHRQELLQNLLWLAQTGEQTIPALLEGLQNDHPKVRASCCWVLGRMRDRRTAQDLLPLTRDPESSVRMEASRSLVLMGDIDQAPSLILGLDSDRKEVRFLCHEALKAATGHDFGYDHLGEDQQERQRAVLRWREWWGTYSGDLAFAEAYEREQGLRHHAAAPAGETDAAQRPEAEAMPTVHAPGSEAANHAQPETPAPKTPSGQEGGGS